MCAFVFPLFLPHTAAFLSAWCIVCIDLSLQAVREGRHAGFQEGAPQPA